MNSFFFRKKNFETNLPKSVQFDESSDAYRCLCSCFHVKTGAFCIIGIEIFLLICYFINSLLILIQQKDDLNFDQSKKKDESTSNYVQFAFLITTILLSFAFICILLTFIGLARNIALLLIPHIIVQAISILCFTGLLLIGVIALATDNAFCYRILHAAPFNDFPGQTTVAFSSETLMRIYLVIGLYALSLALECWFIVIIYNCHRYIIERRKYMNYCLAYSTPMKTLNSAR